MYMQVTGIESAEVEAVPIMPERTMRQKFSPITERLRNVAAEVGGGTALARLLGKPPQTMANYLAGRSMLKANDLIKIERLTGISMRWLVLGVGPKYLHEEGQQAGQIYMDVMLLEKIMALLEQWLSGGRTMTPDQKARFAAQAYIFCSDAARENKTDSADEASKNIFRLLKIAL